jgi:hypothetical protein
MIVAAVVAGIPVFGAGAGDARADAGTVVVVSDDNHVPLAVDDQGKLTADVTLVNSSATPVTVKAKLMGGPAGCHVVAPKQPLAKYHQSKMTFEFPGCAADNAVSFSVFANGQRFDLTADATKTSPHPNWWLLLAFPLAAVVALIVVGVTYLVWSRKAAARCRTMYLPGLDAKWTFKDSWAANATVVGAAFTGVFGTTDVTTALLGDEATNVLAIAVVAAAVAVGLAGVGPMVLQALRREFKQLPEGITLPVGFYVTPLGLIAAAVCTLAGIGGQLAVLVLALKDTHLWADGAMLGVGAAGLLLLGWYSATATFQNLETGETPPPAETKTTTARLALTPTAVEGASFTGQTQHLVTTTMVETTGGYAARPGAIL